MSYANIVSTIALVIAALSLVWQVHIWLHQKKQEGMPNLKVGLRKRQKDYSFVIENMGKCAVTILECTINDLNIINCAAIHNAANIINARIEPQNSLVHPFLATRGSMQQMPFGSPVKLKIKVDSGKFFEKEYAFSEEWE